MSRNKKSRKRIHDGTARHGGRPTILQRMEQSAKARGVKGYEYTPLPASAELKKAIEKIVPPPSALATAKSAKGFLRRIFNRKVG